MNDKTGYDSTVKGFKTYLRGVVSPLSLKNHKRYLRDDFNKTWYDVFGKIKYLICFKIQVGSFILLQVYKY